MHPLTLITSVNKQPSRASSFRARTKWNDCFPEEASGPLTFLETLEQAARRLCPDLAEVKLPQLMWGEFTPERVCEKLHFTRDQPFIACSLEDGPSSTLSPEKVFADGYPFTFDPEWMGQVLALASDVGQKKMTPAWLHGARTAAKFARRRAESGPHRISLEQAREFHRFLNTIYEAAQIRAGDHGLDDLLAPHIVGMDNQLYKSNESDDDGAYISKANYLFSASVVSRVIAEAHKYPKNSCVLDQWVVELIGDNLTFWARSGGVYAKLAFL